MAAVTQHEGRVRPAADVLIQKMPDGDAVLLHMGSEVYFGLDPIGARIWEGLAGGESPDDTIAALLDEYDVEADRLRTDRDELIGRLRESGLVTVDDE